jgi:FAD/FMN-containing dehydrogenase
MLRRSLLTGAAAVALAPVSVWAAPAAAPRRVRPGDPAWPDASAWESLNKAVGGRLIEPKPLLEACIADPESGACKATLKSMFNPFFLGDQVSGTQVSGWYNAWSPAVSARAVAARNTVDVQAAVNFARTHNLRLVVKGGGHSYQGTSNAPDSLLVWTRPMRDVTVHEAFTPSGGHEAVPAVSVGAGAVWLDVYDAVTTKAGRYAQGGGCTTVGVAGHVQSGGFGSLSKTFGTAAGSLLEAEVVTADGAARIVNQFRDPELYWALKGGGGGGFGVVTRLTLRTHPLPEIFGGVGGRLHARTPQAYRALVARFIAFYADTLANHPWGEQVAFRPGDRLTLSLLTQGLTEDAMRALWAPFVAWTADPSNDIDIEKPIEPWSTPARDFWNVAGMRNSGVKAMRYDERPGARPNQGWWSGDQDQVGMFLHGYDSLWLPKSLLASDRQAQLVDAVIKGARAAPVAFHFNKGLAGALPGALELARDTATNPKVLDAFALVIIANGGMPLYAGVPWKAPDPASPRNDAEAVDRAMAPLYRIAPDGGSYVSESNFFNPSWSQAFWGENYPRLLRAKRRYDPHGLFFAHHGVGSESWSADGFQRRA